MTKYIGEKIGKVETKIIDFNEPLQLESGETLPQFSIAYETYGTLNDNKTNAVLIVHALSGDAHAAGINVDSVPGWWNDTIGPGLPIDTNRFFVICTNVIGGCKGSTGPNSML